MGDVGPQGNEQKTLLHFVQVSPVPGEEEKTNPGVFGQALAGWVREKLIANGYAITEEPIPEDWGWVVMVHRKPFMLWVGCGNQVGNSKQWDLFVEAEPGLMQNFSNV